MKFNSNEGKILRPFYTQQCINQSDILADFPVTDFSLCCLKESPKSSVRQTNEEEGGGDSFPEAWRTSTNYSFVKNCTECKVTAPSCIHTAD